ncbi:MAG: type II toxin-antitoxin system VapC family toxin [Candidatus Helarchaeota archaeon]|nr:type II toxin-antitoxin system VapC family toxin [Candidatus Helarchaeota archaeon]
MDFQKICIDTDYLVDVLRKKPNVLRIISIFEEKRTILATTSINSFELFYGAYKSNRPKNIRLVRKLLERLIILDWKNEFSEISGKILAELESKGEVIDFRDLFIGIIALKNGYELLTRNEKHYQSIPNLELVESE